MNRKPTILCEGKTDNIYLKSAINVLSDNYPFLAKVKQEENPYELLVGFFKYSKRTRFLLDLYGGGLYLYKFVLRYIDNLNNYKTPSSNQPVIILLDNDSGCNSLLNHLENNSLKFPECPNKKEDMRKSKYLPITDNLYVILIPRINKEDTEMEQYFNKDARDIKIDGRKFDPSKDADTTTTYGKNTFSIKVVKEMKGSISFDGFNPILNQISSVIEYHKNKVKQYEKS